MGTIEKIKEKITKLEEMADMEDMFGDDGEEPPEMLDDEGKPIKMKTIKKKMCESIRKTGKCKNTAKTCKFAHNPIELELIPASTKISNLTNVVRGLDKSMRANKSMQDWIPPSDGRTEDCKYNLNSLKTHYQCRYSNHGWTLRRQTRKRKTKATKKNQRKFSTATTCSANPTRKKSEDSQQQIFGKTIAYVN